MRYLIALLLATSVYAAEFEWQDSLACSPYYVVVENVTEVSGMKVGTVHLANIISMQFVATNQFYSFVPVFVEPGYTVYFNITDRLLQNLEVDGKWLVHVSTIYMIEKE